MLRHLREDPTPGNLDTSQLIYLVTFIPAGAFPPIVVRGQTFNGSMPPHKDLLSTHPEGETPRRCRGVFADQPSAG
jgi:hypothetical protein